MGVRVEWGLLQGVPEEDRRAVLKAAARRRFAAGDVVFHEGDPGDTLHLIASGKVAVQVSTPGGDVATLAVLAAGDFFGDLALVDEGSRRSATVRAIERCETLAVHRDDFNDLCRRRPSVERFLVLLLATQVRRLSGQVLEALYVPAEQRVLRRLAGLVALWAGDGTVVTIPVTQEELASMAGTTRPTANRALQDLAAAGVVELGRGRVVVLDSDALTRRAR